VNRSELPTTRTAPVPTSGLTRSDDRLALLENLDANPRELLTALDRQVTRINAIESGLARVDERTRK